MTKVLADLVPGQGSLLACRWPSSHWVLTWGQEEEESGRMQKWERERAGGGGNRGTTGERRRRRE